MQRDLPAITETRIIRDRMEEEKADPRMIVLKVVSTRTEITVAVSPSEMTEGKADLRDRLDPVWEMVRTDVPQAVPVVAMVHVITVAVSPSEMTDRVVSTETTSRARHLLRKPPVRILKRNVKRTRDVSARRGINVLKKI